MTRRRTVQLLLLATCGLQWATPRVARAQNPAAAEALFDQARAAMAAGSYDIACARFRDSDKLDPAIGTRFNLADCEEKRGKVATAWSLFRRVLAELAEDDDRRPIAERRVKALEPRMPYLTLKRTPETPPGARVRIDGAELGEGSLDVPLPMDPGAHDLRLLLVEDGPEQGATFSLREGEHKDLPVDGSIGTALPAADGATANGAGVALSGQTRRKWAYISGGVGAFGVAFGTVTGIVALSKSSDSDDNGFGTLSAVGFGVGVVGLAAGAYLWFTAPKDAGPNGHPASARQPRSELPVYASIPLRPELRLARGAGFLSLEGGF